jgi:hypothetical protein
MIQMTPKLTVTWLTNLLNSPGRVLVLTAEINMSLHLNELIIITVIIVANLAIAPWTAIL